MILSSKIDEWGRDVLPYFALGFSVLFLVLIGIVTFKVFVKKENVGTYYTPFDNITGQTTIEFHEEKIEKEQEDGQGDDKDKNKSKKNESIS